MPSQNQLRDTVLSQLTCEGQRETSQLKDSVLGQLKCAEKEEKNRKQKLMTELGGILRDGDYRSNSSSSKRKSQVGKLMKQISECKIRPFLVFDGDVSPRHKVAKRRHSSPAYGSPGFDALQNILDRHMSPLVSQTDPLHRRGSRNVGRFSEQSSVSDILNDSFFSTDPVSKDGGSLSSEHEELQEVFSESVFDQSHETYFKNGKVCTWC